MPDMASTFFLQSLTSTVFSCTERITHSAYVCQLLNDPIRRLSVSLQPLYETESLLGWRNPCQTTSNILTPAAAAAFCFGELRKMTDVFSHFVSHPWGPCHCLLAKSVSLASSLCSVFISPEPTFSVSSFLTDLRLARRSKETLCLEPSSERRMASAETLTLLRLGLLNFPRRSSTLMFRSLICGGSREEVNHRQFI